MLVEGARPSVLTSGSLNLARFLQHVHRAGSYLSWGYGRAQSSSLMARSLCMVRVCMRPMMYPLHRPPMGSSPRSQLATNATHQISTSPLPPSQRPMPHQHYFLPMHDSPSSPWSIPLAYPSTSQQDLVLMYGVERKKRKLG